MIKIMLTKFDSHMQEVISGTILAFVLKIAGSGLNFGLSVAVARLFGAEGAGIYFLAFSMMAIGSVIGRVGLDNALLRLVASRASHQEWGEIKGIYSLGMKLSVFASVVTSGVFFAASEWYAITVFDKPELANPLRWMSLAIVPYSLINLHAESLKGISKIKNAMLIQGVGVPFLSLLMIYPISLYAGIEGAVWGYLIATVIIGLSSIWTWRFSLGKENVEQISFPVTEMVKLCKPLFWISIMQRAILPWAPLFFLGVWGSTQEVGMFGAALRVAMLASLFALTINNVIAPKFASLFSNGDIEALATTTRRSSLLLTVLSSPIFIILMFASSTVMGGFGEEFEKAGVLLTILSAGHFTSIISGSVGYLLMMTGNEVIYRNLTILSVIVQVVMALILIPMHGAIGAAVSVSIALLFLNFSSVLAVHYKLGFYSAFFLNSFQK